MPSRTIYPHHKSKLGYNSFNLIFIPTARNLTAVSPWATSVIISPFQSMFCHPKSAPAQHFFHALDQFWSTKDPWPTDPLPRVSMPRPMNWRVRGVKLENALQVSLIFSYVSLSPKKNTKRSQTNCETMQLPKFPPFTHTSSTQ